MATRATYEIENHLFYIHHDGYPKGAAQYFLAAMEEGMKNDTITLEEAFVRANRDNAVVEPIWTHDDHSDTDYRYTVKTAPYQLNPKDMTLMIRVDKKAYNTITGLSYWATDYFGTLVNFIAENTANVEAA